jgi:hypothetical protein
VALAAGLALVVLLSALGQLGLVVLHSRTFYGTYRVEVTDDVAVLVHGTTTHGVQDRAPGRSTEPTAYYSRQGPLGDAFAAVRPTTVGAVGLGAGTVAAYGEPGQSMTFFELDPEIVRIASDPRYFTYVEQSRADVHMVVGDGRLSLARTPDDSFDMLVLDAFSSDSIPLHLLTEEAMQMYGDRLAPDGLMMVHISNNLFDLEPVLAAAADDLGWAAAVRHAAPPDGLPSTWVAMSRDPAVLGRVTSRGGWESLGDREVRWTDDYSSVLPVLK